MKNHYPAERSAMRKEAGNDLLTGDVYRSAGTLFADFRKIQETAMPLMTE